MTLEEQIMHRFIYRGSSRESAKEDARAILFLFKSMVEEVKVKFDDAEDVYLLDKYTDDLLRAFGEEK